MTVGPSIAATMLALITATVHGQLAQGSADDREEDGAMTVTRVEYGDAPEQFADLWAPGEPTDGSHPVVVLVHGGFWRARFGLDLMEPLAADLVGRGYVVWNIEYRRVGHAGGGYPGTLADVADAIDELTSLPADTIGNGTLDLERVAFVGHSAGGHLAFWAAGRDLLPTGAPGADPALLPVLVVGQGPVGDLEEAARAGPGNGAVVDLMGGGPQELPAEYASANPSIGPDVAVAVVRGELDDVVRPDYSVPAAARPVTEIDVAGEDHFDLIDPASRSWAHVIALLEGFAR